MKIKLGGCGKQKIENEKWKVLSGCQLRVVGERTAGPGARLPISTGRR